MLVPDRLILKITFNWEKHGKYIFTSSYFSQLEVGSMLLAEDPETWHSLKTIESRISP